MRSTHTTTSQTTCDHEDCTTYAITAGMSATGDELAARHRRMLADDGWTDREGRDYCPDHPTA
ncbi:hypothetical protein [Streptomyces sp. NPDC056543]|uniref:hypothetical protein n=1 Tax=unclassified Streptomyces TaxID=2593676 RepID=UPI0036C047F5